MKLANNDILIKAGVGVLAFYLVGRPILKNLGLWPTDPLKTITPEDKAIIDKAGKPTITRTEAKAIADAQLAAMSSWGTDEDALFNSLKGLTGPDLAQVFVEFGNKWYDVYFGTESWAWVPKAKNLNLFAWYANELDKKDMAKMAAVWKSSNLKFPAV